MGIDRLRRLTHTIDPDALRAQEGDRAAAPRTRWRALHRLAATPARRLRDAYRERNAARELDALTDEVLRDIGLRRDVDGRVVAAPREWNGRHGPATGASPSPLDRPRPHGLGNATDPRQDSPSPSSTERPECVPRHDEPGRRAA